MTDDRYGRTAPTCAADGVDFGEWLVRNGYALDWLQYSKGKYEAAQRGTERAVRGMWEGSYVRPWLYRACIRSAERRAAARMTRIRIPNARGISQRRNS
ncbi:thermonuclease family protein [Bradyrhizobium sp. CCGUVB1N3]|uniref:thermonuclease family protein n=1 Tax=Bradyrhizobium sp. CCGUVB1N3 TaxID=2949629 RepID=UPI0035323EEA